jgi:2-polyprenyl-6-methoxyphenol hydroxylase-like FAD-dependent oxidoreductase
MADYDVLICGAGVAGLTLASVLGHQGRRVLVIDKHVRPANVHKGEVLQPRSLEIFRDLGVLTPLRTAGALAMERLVAADASGRQLLCLDYRMLPGDFQHSLVHYHRTVTEILLSRVPPSVEFCLGVTADGLCRDPAGRVAGARLRRADQRWDVSAVLTVAADGYQSRLRKAAAIDAAMRQYDHHLVALDIGDMPDLGPDIIMYLARDGGRVVYQMPGGRARLYASVPVGGFRGVGRARVREWIASTIGSMPALAPMSQTLQRNLSDVQVLSAWRFSAAAWARPGLVLVGDAAHCVHPMVGQGMNAAIADSWALGMELARAERLTAGTVDAALQRYEEARRPQVKSMARLSHSIATFFAGTSLPGRTVRPLLMMRPHKPNLRLRYKLTYEVAGYGSRPLNLWDWVCASRVIPDPRRQAIPLDVRDGPDSRPLAAGQRLPG